MPYIQKTENANIVTLPDIPFNKIPRFWDRVKKANIIDLPSAIDANLISEVSILLETANLKKPEFSKTKDLWEKAEKEVINEIYNVLPTKVGKIKKITIYPTCFGTSASFNWANDNHEIVVYLREDQGIHTITEAILTSLTRRDIYDQLDGLWSESEIVTDFLVTQTSIAKVLEKYEHPNNYIATMKGVRVKQHAKLLQQSDEFYKKLGLPSLNKPFGQNGLVPELNKKPLENLNIQEQKVLLLLIKNSNNVVSIDEISEAMFETEDDFSLYAVAKLIQRLRNKLEQNGISGSFIQTLRGKGYLLKN